MYKLRPVTLFDYVSGMPYGPWVHRKTCIDSLPEKTYQWTLLPIRGSGEI